MNEKIIDEENTLAKTSRIDLDFKCLICGEDLPTTKEKRTTRGGHYSGPREYYATIYDTSKDSYFIMTKDTEKIKESYFKSLNKLLEKEKIELEEEVLNNISKDKFKDLVLTKGKIELDKNYEIEEDRFKRFINRFGTDYSNLYTGNPRYGVDPSCMNRVLENSEETEEIKFVTERRKDLEEEKDVEKKKVLKYEAKIRMDKFQDEFNYLSQCFNLPRTEDDLILEFIHFGEYKK